MELRSMNGNCDKCRSKALTFIRYSGAHLCKKHFLDFVERRVRKDLKKQVVEGRWKGRMRIAVALSGGKDSVVALTMMKMILSKRKDTDLVAILVDEGIAGYRSKTMEAAEKICQDLDVPLTIGHFEKEFGVTMDQIAKLGSRKGPCTYCGVLRRKLLNIMSRDVGACYLVTGLNLDDTAQSVLMNMARGDVERLARLGPHLRGQEGLVPRIQPLRVIPEKESYLYALVKGLSFGDAECPHSKEAIRNSYRKVIFELEDAYPGTRHSILRSYVSIKEALSGTYLPARLKPCKNCSEPTMGEVCKACTLVAQIRAQLDKA